MARPADPTRTRRQTGNRPKPGEAKVADLVPTEVKDLVEGKRSWEPPADLPELAKPIWNDVVAELEPRGLRPADLEAVRVMVLAAVRHRQASAAVDQYGLIVEGPKGPMVNPAVKIEKDTAATFLRFAEAFGLTLAARLRLGLMQLAGESILTSLSKDLDTPPITIEVNP
jgi:P27 family predicted phage terminase small subunit